MPATITENGSVILSNGRVLSAAEMAEAKAAKPAIRPLTIKTASGRNYGQSGPARYGIAMDPETGSWHFLDSNWEPIPNTAWKARNLCRASFTFLNQR